MKQYIKKALWIIPFVFSLNLSGQSFSFVGTGTGTLSGSTLSNWDDGAGNNPTSADFTNGGTQFDANGKTIDLAGLTLGPVVFLNNTGTGKFVNTGTIYCESSDPFEFNFFGSGAMTVDLYSAGKVVYNHDGLTSGLSQTLGAFPHNNIELYDGVEYVINSSTTSIYGKLENTKNINPDPSNIKIQQNITLKSTATFSFLPGTVVYLQTSGVNLLTDERSSANKLFPETWVINQSRTITSIPTPFTNIPVGTYDYLDLNDQYISFVMNGNLTTKYSLDLANGYSGTPSAANVPVLNINGYKLTVKGTLTGHSTRGRNFVLRMGTTETAELEFDGVDNGSGGQATIFIDVRSSGVTPNDAFRICKNLTLVNGSKITLGNYLDISGGTASSPTHGVVTVNNSTLYTTSSTTSGAPGNLTLNSNQYGTAMIIDINSSTIKSTSTSNTTTLLVENFIGSSGRGRQYRFLSSPVSGGLFYQWRDSLNNRSGRGIHITGDYTKALETGSGKVDSFDLSTTNHPSAFTWDETKAGNITGINTTLGATEDPGWSRLSQANTNTIENGKGYRILVRGDRTVRLTSGGTGTVYDPNNTTIQTRGGYVAGPVTVPITNSGSKTNNGINLIGNPYACAVDWHAVYNASSNLDASYVLYDPTNKRWQAYNAASTTPSIYRYISPGQGFLVYTNNPTTSGGGGGGSVVFPLICKTTSDAGSRTFTEIKTNHLITHLRRDTTAADMNIIYFLSGATNYYDKYDAGHIQNEYVNLSSVDSTNTLYNINCLDSLVGQRIVPLSVYGTPQGIYTMAFDDVNTFRNHDVFLIDNFLKKTTKVDDFTQYNVEITEDKFSYAEGRFYISFEPKSTASIVSLTKTENFNINPNPVKDVINISMKTSVFGDLRYEIFNINGQIISKGSLNEGENRINSTDLSKGIYFITLKTNSETQTIKFIK